MTLPVLGIDISKKTFQADEMEGAKPRLEKSISEKRERRRL